MRIIEDMQNIFIRKNIEIKTSLDEVWNAITDPKKLKENFFVLDVKSDWKEGSPINYKGIWKGKKYEDKGKIVKIIPQQYLATVCSSSLSNLSNNSENYKKVSYKLIPSPFGTKLVVIEENNFSQEELESSNQYWTESLAKLKENLEKS